METIITVQEEKMSEELMKFHLRGLPFDAVIHKFTGRDVGEPHDHPFTFRTFVLKGGYVERRFHIINGKPVTSTIERKVGDSFIVSAQTIHQIIELLDKESWTMILPERWEQNWSFYQFGDEILSRYWDEPEFKPLKR